MALDPTVPRLRDADLTKTIALPNGAASVMSGGIDLSASRHLAGAEILVLAPALGVTPLPNAKTMTYIVEFSGTPNFAAITRSVTVGLQTGAGGVGDIADQYRTGIESTAERYVRLKVTGSAAGDATAATATIGVAV